MCSRFASSIVTGRYATGVPVGSNEHGCEATRNSSPTHANERAIGPIAPSVENGPTHGGTCPIGEILPEVGLKAQIPEKCAGSRTDPPLSLPSPAADIPAAIAAASPPLEPPAVRSRSQGLFVRPCIRLSVS